QEEGQSTPWLNQVETVPWLAVPFLDESVDTTTLAYFYRELEDLPPSPQQYIPWTARPSLDEDPWVTAPSTAVDDEQPFVALLQAIPWLPRPSLDDGIDTTTLKNFALEQEEGQTSPWLNQVETTPWLAVPFLDESVDSTSLAYFFREYEDLPPAPQQS